MLRKTNLFSADLQSTLALVTNSMTYIERLDCMLNL